MNRNITEEPPREEQQQEAPEEERKSHFAEGEEEELTLEELPGEEWTQEIESFDDLGLKEEVLRGIYGYGFEKPSPIQRKAIQPVILGKDTIAQGQSGTGKPATFTIAAL